MASLEPLPYFKWFWRDFRANRTVQRMNYVERGLYRELLDECWAEGCIPDNIPALADLCGCPVDVLASAWHVLSKCFTETSPGSGLLINPRLERERTAKDAERAMRQVAGRSGGLAKAGVVACAKQVLANPSKCHIAEQSRAEQKQEQENPPTPQEGAMSGSTKKPRGLSHIFKARPDALEWFERCLKERGEFRAWAEDAANRNNGLLLCPENQPSRDAAVFLARVAEGNDPRLLYGCLYLHLSDHRKAHRYASPRLQVFFGEVNGKKRADWFGFVERAKACLDARKCSPPSPSIPPVSQAPPVLSGELLGSLGVPLPLPVQ